MLENSMMNLFLVLGPIAFGSAFIYFAIPKMYASIRKIVDAEGYPDKVDLKVVQIIKAIGVGALVIGGTVAITSPTVVPKNTVGDPAAQIRKIESINRQDVAPAPGELVDNTRQPTNTSEERKALFDAMVDYKK